ncbi:MAG: thiamine pyrophosphate-binding protein [Thermoplasmatales archaeon]|nr:thiamine pyrophosphate-binding protein [Thermoplasmatales archaeon]
MTETSADWIISFLEKQGIEYIFSHPGGSVLPFYESLRKNGSPKNVLVRHEGAGSFMADAYAKVTGKVGVCMSTMGPGAANMTIGVGTAMSDSTPLLAITGQLEVGSFGRGYQQETDHNALFKGITKATIQLKQAESAAETFERGYRMAISPRTGPVHIDAPVDISRAEIKIPRPFIRLSMVKMGPAEEAYIEEAWKLIKKASMPILLVGGGAIQSNASSEIIELAETLSIPIATSYNGRGIIPEDHPLALGRVGEYTPSYVRKMASRADLLIAIGYRFSDVSMEGWKPSPDAKIIQIDTDPREIGKIKMVDIPLAGDAARTINVILKKAKEAGKSRKGWVDEIKEARSIWKRAYSKVEVSDAVPLKPQRVIREITNVIKKDTIICSGAGRAKMWAASLLPIYGPRKWIHSGGYAPMGYEIPAAIASKLARPKSLVLSIGGDASFQMHAQEIATAVEYKAPFVGVVLNDIGLGAIKNAQLKKYEKVFGTEFQYDVDLAKVSEAFGGLGLNVTKPSEIRNAIDDAVKSSKPYILNVKVDNSEIPYLDY